MSDRDHNCHENCSHPPVEFMYDAVNGAWLEANAEYPMNMIGINMRAAIVDEDGVNEVPFYGLVMLRQPKFADGSPDDSAEAWVANMRPYMIPMSTAVKLARDIMRIAISMNHPAVYETGAGGMSMGGGRG
jgi:hypothetical protein